MMAGPELARIVPIHAGESSDDESAPCANDRADGTFNRRSGNVVAAGL